MPSTALFTPFQTRPVVYGPATQTTIQSFAALANNTFQALGIADASHFLEGFYAYVRSSVAGEIRIEDNVGGTYAAATVAVATWTFLNMGGLGFIVNAVNRDLGVRQITGGAANIDIILAYSKG